MVPLLPTRERRPTGEVGSRTCRGERNAQRQDRRRSARSRARLRDQLRAGEQLAGAALLSEEEGRRLHLYPTSYVKTSASESVISTINEPGMLTGAKTSLAEQATAFDTVANVYAPYYRQADALTVLSSPLATQNQICAGVPTHDATAAFAYYIEHSNHGRPFFLAGHSQGSNVLLFLLSGYLKQHPAVYRRMVAANVIGYGVTRTYLAANPQLKFATGAASSCAARAASPCTRRVPADSPEASSTSTTTCSIASTCATTPGIGSSTT
jgi:hypothetical protein